MPTDVEGDDNPPAPKMVRLEELETSIEKIVERSLQKATQGHLQANDGQATSSNTTGEEEPPPKRKGFSLIPFWAQG